MSQQACFALCSELSESIQLLPGGSRFDAKCQSRVPPSRSFSTSQPTGEASSSRKAVENLVSQQRNQTFNYLLLVDLPHIKIINTRTESVDDEFVSYHTSLADIGHPRLII
jgi:hypothetical protein